MGLYIIFYLYHSWSKNTKTTTTNILIVFYTHYKNTAGMTDEISQGTKEMHEATVAIKRIADDATNLEKTKIVKDLDQKYPPISIDDLVN